jgi:hypothetical protein
VGKSRRGFPTVWKLPSPHVSGNRVQSLERPLYIWKKKRKRNTDSGEGEEMYLRHNWGGPLQVEGHF